MYEYKGVKFQVFKFKNVYGVFVGDSNTSSQLLKTKDEAIEYAKNEINQKTGA